MSGIGYKLVDKNYMVNNIKFEIGETYGCSEDIKMYTIYTELIDCIKDFDDIPNGKVLQVKYKNILTKSGKLKYVDEIFIEKEITVYDALKYSERFYSTEWVKTGQDNVGENNIGINNIGNKNIGKDNDGYHCIGRDNIGCENIGRENNGELNIGENNNGKTNVGHFNCGNGNYGSKNNGNSNIGYTNRGDCNIGQFCSGNRNYGKWNKGLENMGMYNSGISNIGYFNKAINAIGVFNTKLSKVSIFNKPTDLTMGAIKNQLWFKALMELDFYPTKTISSENECTERDLTIQEKKMLKEHKVLCIDRTEDEIKDTCRNNWKSMSNEYKKAILSMPNFDKNIFFKITGINVDE